MKQPFSIPHLNVFTILAVSMLLIGFIILTGNSNFSDDSFFGSSITGNAPGARTSTLPSCIKDWEQEPMLSGIVTYLKDSRNSNVITAWNPCGNIDGILQLIEQDLIEAETKRINLGIIELPDAPLPENWETASTGTANYVNCGSSAHEIIAAKVAARILVDSNDMVPWNLRDNSREDVERLFTNDAESGHCNFYNVVDHSPREAWNVLASKVDPKTISSQAALNTEIMKMSRKIRHGGVWKLADGTILKRDDQGIVTIPQMVEEQVSRHGCWSMTAFFGQLASNFNVPGYVATNQYAENGHATYLSPIANQVLGHGDDAYNALYGDTPALKVFNDYSFWKREVIKKNPTTTSYQKSLLHEYEMARTYPSNYIMYDYCHYTRTNAGKTFASGRDYLRSISFRINYNYWTEAQLDELETAIKTKTQNCAFIPANDPEN